MRFSSGVEIPRSVCSEGCVLMGTGSPSLQNDFGYLVITDVTVTQDTAMKCCMGTV